LIDPGTLSVAIGANAGLLLPLICGQVAMKKYAESGAGN
jgi:hypothetical protein